MANLNISLIEFGTSIVILAIFIALLALAKDIIGLWSNLAYLVIIMAFTAAMCLFGMKLAPYLY